jgi:L-alanine-DL-glutamate epimerase-like enolase superfamily enzyme
VPLLAGEKFESAEGFRPYLDNQVLDMIHPDVGHSLIRFYASMHLGAVLQNFFKVENALGAFRGNKEKMSQGPKPSVRKSVFPAREGRDW